MFTPAKGVFLFAWFVAFLLETRPSCSSPPPLAAVVFITSRVSFILLSFSLERIASFHWFDII